MRPRAVNSRMRQSIRAYQSMAIHTSTLSDTSLNFTFPLLCKMNDNAALQQMVNEDLPHSSLVSCKILGPIRKEGRRESEGRFILELIRTSPQRSFLC